MIKIYYNCVQCGSDNYWTIDGKCKTHTCPICGVENPYKVLGFAKYNTKSVFSRGNK